MSLSLATLRSWRRGNGLATSLVVIGAAFIAVYFTILPTDAQDFAYQVPGMVDLTRRLGAATIAEGIEAATELAELRQIGCAMGQGYHFSPALPPAELEDLLGLAEAQGAPVLRPAPSRLTAG